MMSSRSAVRRAAWVLAAALLIAATVHAAPTPKPHRPTKVTGTPKPAAVTDANVVDHVLGARTKADHEALAAYYKAQALAEDSRIAHYEQLFRAYMRLEGPKVEPLQRQARMLLKAARMSKRHDELLAQAHLNLAWTNNVNQ